MVEEENKVSPEEKYFDRYECKCKICGWITKGAGQWNDERTQHAILHKLTDLLDILEDVKNGNAVLHMSERGW